MNTYRTAALIMKTIQADQEMVEQLSKQRQINKLSSVTSGPMCLCGSPKQNQNFSPYCPEHKHLVNLLNFAVVYRRGWISKD